MRRLARRRKHDKVPHQPCFDGTAFASALSFAGRLLAAGCAAARKSRRSPGRPCPTKQGAAAKLPQRKTAPQAEEHVYGIVMAGGLSSRMGEDKRRLSIHDDGKDLLEHTVSLLREYAEAVFVSSRAPQDAPFPVIPDMVERMGPFGGLYSVLHRLNGPLLVLSCDLPFMDRETLVRLLAARRDRERGTIMTTFQQAETGFIEALVAVYEPACLPWFQMARDRGIRKISDVIPAGLRTHVPYTQAEALPFFNVNYPADLEIARRLSALMRREHGPAGHRPPEAANASPSPAPNPSAG